MGRLVHYLLVFDHDAGELIDEKYFEDADEAVAKYSEVEKCYEDRKRIEVVLIGSDSLETIKRTHANYFDGSVSVSDLLSSL
jgi:hypothetical protein